jgi:hypothetical protein
MAQVSHRRQASQFHGLPVHHDGHLELLASSCIISSFSASIKQASAAIVALLLHFRLATVKAPPAEFVFLAPSRL